jgi:hypothetical protein
MTTKFVDPKDVFLELDSQFNFDPALTGFTIGAIEEQVFKFMATFFQNNLNTFNTPFRRSNLTTEIDSLDKSILSTRIQVRVQMILNVVANETVTETIFFPMKIASPDDIFHRVESQTFEFNGIIGLIKNKLSSTTLQIFDLDGNILLDNVGEYNAQTGAVEIVGFNPSAITGGGNFLKIRVVPENESFISPLRNYIIKLDTTKSSATAIVDRQTPSLEVNI